MQPRLGFVAATAACALVFVVACSTAPNRTSVPAPADWTPETERDPLADATSRPEPSLEPVPSAEPSEADESPAPEGSGGRGLIAAAGPTGLRLLQPSGRIVGELGVDHIVTQPTWSRDGRRLVATLTNPVSGASQVAIVDITTGNIVTADARSPYFFYTWNYDSSRLAALGPGSSGGTALDILDGTGKLSAPDSLQGQSMYVAWEPGGRRLLLHAGPQLVLISDPDTPGEYVDLGVVGSDFQAPSWVPGTSDFLYVDSVSQALDGIPREESDDSGVPVGPWLLRRDTESGEISNLGQVGGFTEIAVHPEGGRAALSLAPPPQRALPGSTEEFETIALSSTDDPADDGGTSGGASESSGSIEIVDLATAERVEILDRGGAWLEWSPDGDHLLIATLVLATDGGPALAWHVWDGETLQELVRFTPSAAFAQRYLPFAGQYTETPRLWSPDSDAITFGADTADGSVTAVARLDSVGTLTSLGPSDVSFWSPLHNGPSQGQPG